MVLITRVAGLLLTSSVGGALAAEVTGEPKAKSDSIKLWPTKTEDITDVLLDNDDTGGGTLQVTAVTQPSRNSVARLHLRQSTHVVTIKSDRLTYEPITVTFTYTVTRVEDGATSTATSSVALRPVRGLSAKRVGHHHARWHNRMPGSTQVKAYVHHHVIARFRVPKGSWVTRRVPGTVVTWNSFVGPYRVPADNGNLGVGP